MSALLPNNPLEVYPTLPSPSGAGKTLYTARVGARAYRLVTSAPTDCETFDDIKQNKL